MLIFILTEDAKPFQSSSITTNPEYYPSPHQKKAVVIIAHGLNVIPSAMLSLVEWFNNQGSDAFLVKLAGHCQGSADSANTMHNTRQLYMVSTDIAEQWLRPELSDAEITALGTYQHKAEDMIAWPVAKDFMRKENPEEEFVYEHLQPL